ncbi:MarR family winged helix-turn-helix transcriptional regulator [Streptomyces sp. NPDC051561]|uniref:MarR family winged helix-turn-helix transcriptional regulator n=1 Tax=Streptomyces sp. NPDC051561 TaxID=3365658 RepID=UPI003797791D
MTHEPACPGLTVGGPVSHSLSVVARLHRITAGRVLRCVGLYPGQEFVMMRLWEAGPVRQSDLIKAVGLDPSTVTKSLQRLEQAGHVRRCPDPKDRRASLVEATEESGVLREQVQEAWVELEDTTLAGLDDTERAELLRLLEKVQGNLCPLAGEEGEAGGC